MDEHELSSEDQAFIHELLKDLLRDPQNVELLERDDFAERFQEGVVEALRGSGDALLDTLLERAPEMLAERRAHRKIWSNVEHLRDGVRLVLSDKRGPDVDLVLRATAVEELGRALLIGGSAEDVNARTVDGELAVMFATGGKVRVEIEGTTPIAFALGEQAVKIGELLLARPVEYEVECPSCGRRSRSTTTVAPSSEIAEAEAGHTEWTCPFCATRVVVADLAKDADDVWRRTT
jgi:endogenous inhibitor of DNA gyrase (YacG/DUF329 family)